MHLAYFLLLPYLPAHEVTAIWATMAIIMALPFYIGVVPAYILAPVIEQAVLADRVIVEVVSVVGNNHYHIVLVFNCER